MNQIHGSFSGLPVLTTVLDAATKGSRTA